MNQYSTNITKHLNLKRSPQKNNLKDIINCYDGHINIKKIRSSNGAQSKRFTFNYISSDKIKHEMLNLNNQKASMEEDTSINILKDAIDTYLRILTKTINFSVEQNEIPNNQKLTNVHLFSRNKISQ